MNGPVFLITVLSLSVVSAAFAVDEPLPTPNWSREAAIEAVDAPAVRESLGVLYHLARTGQDDELMSRTRAISEDATRPAPERDRILHELALGLGELEPGTVGPEVLEFLGDVHSLVRVPHDENPYVGVPLFNIRAAAAGSLAQWQRAATKATPERGFESYTDADTFIEAISGLDSALRIQHIRAARKAFDYTQIEAVVETTPGSADAMTASLLLAELAPTVIDSPSVREHLFVLLGDRELGASAALALARSGNEEVLIKLADLAAGEDSLASRRASMAIDLFLATEGER
jgi:hypothetical protein